MLRKKHSTYVKWLVLSCCVGSFSFATTSVDAAGLAGSYVGIGTHLMRAQSLQQDLKLLSNQISYLITAM